MKGISSPKYHRLLKLSRLLDKINTLRWRDINSLKLESDIALRYFYAKSFTNDYENPITSRSKSRLYFENEKIYYYDKSNSEIELDVYKRVFKLLFYFGSRRYGVLFLRPNKNTHKVVNLLNLFSTDYRDKCRYSMKNTISLVGNIRKQRTQMMIRRAACIITYSDQPYSIRKLSRVLKTTYSITIGVPKDHRRYNEERPIDASELLICSNLYHFYKLGVEHSLKQKFLRYAYYCLNN